MAIDSHASASSLGAGAQQLVELVRALMGHAQIVFMDEPTSGLTDVETRLCFECGKPANKAWQWFILRTAWKRYFNWPIVTVLRDGRTIATLSTRETQSAELVKLMAGKAVSEKAHGLTCR